jgi:hypothetical protein
VTVATDERRSSRQAAPDGAGWSDVLAGVEADMIRTAQLMATSAESVQPRDVAGAPAQAMLPTTFRQYAEATWTTLPELDEMPPVPPELSERIHTLRAQIVALQAEIKAEMTHWQAECTTRRLPSSVSTPAESFYVDRLA